MWKHFFSVSFSGFFSFIHLFATKDLCLSEHLIIAIFVFLLYHEWVHSYWDMPFLKIRWRLQGMSWLLFENWLHAPIIIAFSDWIDSVFVGWPILWLQHVWSWRIFTDLNKMLITVTVVLVFWRLFKLLIQRNVTENLWLVQQIHVLLVILWYVYWFNVPLLPTSSWRGYGA